MSKNFHVAPLINTCQLSSAEATQMSLSFSSALAPMCVPKHHPYWTRTRRGERLSPYVSIACIMMAISVMIS
ncbi:hypothetical protein BC937DRAFT_94318 [Endogone sp. FLAS-F59071]|nr:hypothetical protein BC937DRAFT_94318 [Endogone sp. FLAS-F59071]|eukprot:RUS22972.1 hypothetical protein BC937DRAFT_94318 [Endogone sp. FLAS-F59071]